jgi:hypothetical protein
MESLTRAMTLIPQFKLPLMVDPATGDLATVEQGSAIDTAQRVAVLVSTPPSWLEQAPDFGLYNQAFLAGGADIAEIERQLQTYVPDAAALVTEDLSLLNDALDIIGVQVPGP